MFAAARNYVAKNAAHSNKAQTRGFEQRPVFFRFCVVEAIRVAITFDGRNYLCYIEKEETPFLIKTWLGKI